MVQDGLKRSEMAQGGECWSKIPRRSSIGNDMYILHTYGLSGEGAMAGKKEETLDNPLHFYGLIFLLCSFLLSVLKSFQSHQPKPGRQIVPNGLLCCDGLVGVHFGDYHAFMSLNQPYMMNFQHLLPKSSMLYQFHSTKALNLLQFTCFLWFYFQEMKYQEL